MDEEDWDLSVFGQDALYAGSKLDLLTAKGWRRVQLLGVFRIWFKESSVTEMFFHRQLSDRHFSVLQYMLHSNLGLTYFNGIGFHAVDVDDRTPSTHVLTLCNIGGPLFNFRFRNTISSSVKPLFAQTFTHTIATRFTVTAETAEELQGLRPNEAAQLFLGEQLLSQWRPFAEVFASPCGSELEVRIELKHLAFKVCLPPSLRNFLGEEARQTLSAPHSANCPESLRAKLVELEADNGATATGQLFLRNFAFRQPPPSSALILHDARLDKVALLASVVSQDESAATLVVGTHVEVATWSVELQKAGLPFELLGRRRRGAERIMLCTYDTLRAARGLQWHRVVFDGVEAVKGKTIRLRNCVSLRSTVRWAFASSGCELAKCVSSNRAYKKRFEEPACQVLRLVAFNTTQGWNLHPEDRELLRSRTLLYAPFPSHEPQCSLEWVPKPLCGDSGISSATFEEAILKRQHLRPELELTRDGSGICDICYDPMSSAVVTSCKPRAHLLCTTCFNRWSRSCPFCRAPICSDACMLVDAQAAASKHDVLLREAQAGTLLVVSLADARQQRAVHLKLANEGVAHSVLEDRALRGLHKRDTKEAVAKLRLLLQERVLLVQARHVSLLNSVWASPCFRLLQYHGSPDESVHSFPPNAKVLRLAYK